MRRFLFQTIPNVCLVLDRGAVRREDSLSASVIDRQSIKVLHVKTRGYDVGKKIKRHIATDTLEYLIVGVMHAANIQDRDGPPLVAEKIRLLFS